MTTKDKDKLVLKTTKGKIVHEPGTVVSPSTIFRNANDFSLYVEKLSLETDVTCTSIILDYCEARDMEPDEIARMVSRPLKEKLMIEMQAIGLMKRDAQLVFE